MYIYSNQGRGRNIYFLSARFLLSMSTFFFLFFFLMDTSCEYGLEQKCLPQSQNISVHWRKEGLVLQQQGLGCSWRCLDEILELSIPHHKNTFMVCAWKKSPHPASAQCTCIFASSSCSVCDNIMERNYEKKNSCTFFCTSLSCTSKSFWKQIHPVTVILYSPFLIPLLMVQHQEPAHPSR